MLTTSSNRMSSHQFLQVKLYGWVRWCHALKALLIAVGDVSEAQTRQFLVLQGTVYTQKPTSLLEPEPWNGNLTFGIITQAPLSYP